MLALLSYYGSGQYKKRYLGVPIPRTNLTPDFEAVALLFANELADDLLVQEVPAAWSTPISVAS